MGDQTKDSTGGKKGFCRRWFLTTSHNLLVLVSDNLPQSVDVGFNNLSQSVDGVFCRPPTICLHCFLTTSHNLSTLVLSNLPQSVDVGFNNLSQSVD
jgi:hypothetical protein